MSESVIERISPTAATRLTGEAAAQFDRLSKVERDIRSRLLIKGATVVTMDPHVGNLATGDVLIEGPRITQIAPNITVDAEVIDARGMIAFPGMHDTHRHSWQGALRRLIPSGLIDLYMSAIHFGAGPHYSPQDVYVGNLITALHCIESGITGLLDYSHIRRSPDHADAAIQALVDAGIRARYACAAPLDPSLVGSSAEPGPYDGGWPDDLTRIKEQWFDHDDQLVTLGIAVLPFHVRHETRSLDLARELGARVSIDGFSGPFASKLLARSRDQFGPDVTAIHCLDLDEQAWRTLADTGTHVSLAPTSEPSYEMIDGVAPVRQAVDAGIRPSLSVDADVGLSSDMFSQMRMAFQTHRMSIARETYEGNPQMMARRTGPRPSQITIRDVLEFATVRGAAANGVLDRSGTLTPGKDADIVLIEADDLNTMPLNNAYGTIVLGSDTKNVRTVLIGGKVRKLHGELVGVDLANLRKMVYESRDRVLAAAGRPLDIFSLDLGEDYWGR
ncbi:MAG: amidohydrolase family protein [Ilumatobacteraceae bacterium]